MRFQVCLSVSSILIGQISQYIAFILSKQHKRSKTLTTAATATTKTLSVILSLIRGSQPVVKLYTDFIILWGISPLFKSHACDSVFIMCGLKCIRKQVMCAGDALNRGRIDKHSSFNTRTITKNQRI